MPRNSQISRRHFIGRTATLAFAGALAVRRHPGHASEGRHRRQTSAGVNHPKAPIGDWTFSNWPLYIDKKVLKNFDKQYGGHVKYVEDINDNFEFFGKVRQQLQAGQPIGRDIVTLTDYMAARWVRDGYVEPIDKKNVPNIKNLVANLRRSTTTRTATYTLPWQSGGTGIGYNIKKTGRKLKSVKDLFDPTFKGRVTMLSEPYDSACRSCSATGINASKAKIDQILRRSTRSTRPTMPASSAASPATTTRPTSPRATSLVAMAYSADLVQLRPTTPTCDFVVPEEGAIRFRQHDDPEAAAHPYARRDLDELRLRARGAAKIAAYVG